MMRVFSASNSRNVGSGSFATDRCAPKIVLCPLFPESDGWPSKCRPSRRARNGPPTTLAVQREALGHRAQLALANPCHDSVRGARYSGMPASRSPRNSRSTSSFRPSPTTLPRSDKRMCGCNCKRSAMMLRASSIRPARALAAAAVRNAPASPGLCANALTAHDAASSYLSRLRRATAIPRSAMKFSGSIGLRRRASASWSMALWCCPSSTLTHPRHLHPNAKFGFTDRPRSIKATPASYSPQAKARASPAAHDASASSPPFAETIEASRRISLSSRS